MAKKLMSDIERFWTHVEHQENGCWLWTRAVNNSGYGFFKIYPKMVYAHRFIWEHLHGPLPSGADVHHTCENRLCVNPEHLELVSRREHVLKSPRNITYVNFVKTHCNRGHEYTPENTYTFVGKRHCRECRRIAWRKHDAKRKAG